MRETVDTFFGLDRYKDPEDLEPGRIVDCNNTIIMNGKISPRRFFRKLTDNTTFNALGYITGLHKFRASSYEVIIAVYDDPDGQEIYYLIYALSTQQFTTCAMIAGSPTWTTGSIPQFFEYGSYVYINLGTKAYKTLIGTNGVPGTLTEVIEPSITTLDPSAWKFNAYMPSVDTYTHFVANPVSAPGLSKGDYEYIIVYAKTTSSITRYSKPCKFIHGVPGADGVTTTYQTRIYIKPPVADHPTDSPPKHIGTYYDDLLVYRKDLNIDGSFYWLVGRASAEDGTVVWNDTNNTWEIFDELVVPIGAEWYDTSAVVGIPTYLSAITSYRGRMVYAKNGDIYFSKFDDPEAISIPINGPIPICKGTGQISDMIEVQGTLFIFTTEGIYTLVGTIGDDIASSNYEIFCQHPEVQCYSNIVCIQGSAIYFCDRRELIIYDLMNYKRLGGQLTSIYGYTGPVTGGSLFGIKVFHNEAHQQILVTFQSKTTVLCYHYGETGAWTKWTLYSSFQAGIDGVPVSGMSTFERSPVFLLGSVVCQYYDTVLPAASFQNETSIVWNFTTKDYVGGNSALKKYWRELRVSFSTSGTLAVECKTDEIGMGSSITFGNSDRVRLKKRSKRISFKFTGTLTSSATQVRSFSIESDVYGE